AAQAGGRDFGEFQSGIVAYESGCLLANTWLVLALPCPLQRRPAHRPKSAPPEGLNSSRESAMMGLR
ncbi:MAG TPA: hypothetical protein VGY66_23915, partial [Gemmataceae bacterium]|nr:hypothetical protein [Gemmataceae bacterium]